MNGQGVDITDSILLQGGMLTHASRREDVGKTTQGGPRRQGENGLGGGGGVGTKSARVRGSPHHLTVGGMA